MKRCLLLLLLLLASCGRADDNGWLGYAEGEDAFISAPLAGWVTHLGVQRGQEVKRGDLLFTLEDTHERAMRDQAAASLAQAKSALAQEEANLGFTSKMEQRQAGLARAHAGVPATLDQAQASHQQSQAHIAQLQGQIQQMEGAVADANYQLSQRDVVSHVNGRVEDIYFREGEYVPASTPVISILPPGNIYARFFVPETELARIRIGEKVAISCDNCPKNMNATITFIAQQEEFTAPDIFSVGNREKLVFKAEARIPGGMKLNPGQPLEVRPL